MQHAYKHTHDVTLVCGATNKTWRPMETYGDLWRPMETYGDKSTNPRQDSFAKQKWDVAGMIGYLLQALFNAGLAPYFYIALLILTGTPNEDNAWASLKYAKATVHALGTRKVCSWLVAQRCPKKLWALSQRSSSHDFGCTFSAAPQGMSLVFCFASMFGASQTGAFRQDPEHRVGNPEAGSLFLFLNSDLEVHKGSPHSFSTSPPQAMFPSSLQESVLALCWIWRIAVFRRTYSGETTGTEV